LLITYAAMAGILAEEELASRLDIAAQAVMCVAETLTRAVRAQVRRAWGSEPFEIYSSTETACIGAECHAHAGLHLFEELLVAEVVDEDNRPAPPGSRGPWPGHRNELRGQGVREFRGAAQQPAFMRDSGRLGEGLEGIEQLLRIFRTFLPVRRENAGDPDRVGIEAHRGLTCGRSRLPASQCRARVVDLDQIASASRATE
jgi:hypothetical protein